MKTPLKEIKNKVAVEMGYATWDNLITTSCSSNTPQVIHEAEKKVEVIYFTYVGLELFMKKSLAIIIKRVFKKK